MCVECAPLSKTNIPVVSMSISDMTSAYAFGGCGWRGAGGSKFAIVEVWGSDRGEDVVL